MIPQNNPKKRIVLLTDCLGDLAGGAEKQIYELARGLDKSIYEVYVVSLDCGGQAPRELIESTGSHWHVFRVVRIYGISGLTQGVQFKRFLKDNHIDILMTYHFSSDIWGTFWGHLAGVKTIISNRRDLGFWRNNCHVAAYKLINHWVNKIVTNSESIKTMIIKKEGLPRERIEVIYNGVHLRDVTPECLPRLGGGFSRGSKSELINKTVIMHVANLKPVKGHQYLLEAFARIVQQCPDVILILIGRDEMDGELQQMAQRLNISGKVRFLGLRSDVQSLLDLADIGVLPSLSEGMSNAILEYMAAGKPVVATMVGGNPEMITDGFNGFLVDPKNVLQLKDALLVLINDRQKRLDMGRAGYEKVKQEFSMPAMLSSYARLFAGIKVLHLISSGGLFGAERVVLNLTSSLEGVTSYVGAINNLHNPHLEIVEAARLLDLNTVVFDSKGKFDFGMIIAIKKFIVEHKIDIVHTHNYKSDFAGILAAKLAGVKWMATHHGWTAADQKLKFYERIDLFILKHARKVVLVSQKMKQAFLRNDLKKEQFVVIDNGIPIDQFSRSNKRGMIRKLLGIGPRDCAIAIVGRLSKEKGHDIFLKAAHDVIKDAPDVKFIIVGDGPLREELKQQTHDLNLSDHVIFAGVRPDMPDIYAASDILVNSSYSEGMPMTILEAMASHLTVIATDVGAVGEVIKSEENGVLVRSGDVGQLVLEMIELVQDPEKRQRLCLKAYQDVCAYFSDSVMAQKYKQVYEDVLLT